MKSFISTVVFVTIAALVELNGGIDISGSCPFNRYQCLQCLSRGSSDLETCQQLYFYVTYTNMSNEAEIQRYCTGDCPILLATAQYYCLQTGSIASVFEVCPGYSVEPSGSFNVDTNYSKQNCLEGYRNTRCGYCIGDNTREVLRCLQTYLLALYSNNTATYIQKYCSSNCPVAMWSASWYCNLQPEETRAYDICEKHGATYCVEVEQQSPTDFGRAVAQCQLSCTSEECTDARARYGCCLSRNSDVASRCPDIPECPVDATGATQNINFDRQCLFNAHRCLQCLSRNSDALERCEQLYSIIQNIANHDSEETEFCSGQCPTLLITSRFYCGGTSTLELIRLMNTCPSYEVMPSSAIEIRANYSGQNCFDVVSSLSGCTNCILSRDSDLSRCFQLYILSLYANMTQTYSKAFCTSNCPARLATVQWYCRGISAESIYSHCFRRDEDTYCRSLVRDNTNEVLNMAAACTGNCSSELCNSGIEKFGCCLRLYFSNDNVCPEISSCPLVTVAGTPALAAATMVTLTAALLQFLTYI